MSVHKNRSNNTWYVKYKNKTKRGFKNKREAQLYELNLDLNVDIQEEVIEDIYFYDVANDYLESLKRDVTYGYYDKCRTIFNNVIFPNTENKKICNITEIDCRKFRDVVSDLDYATSYKNFILNKYKATFKHATIYFHLVKDPSRVITTLKRDFNEQMEKKEREKAIWSVDEFSKFIQCVDKEMYKQLYVVLFYTGMRLGEALALTWKDYDGKYLDINKSLTNKTDKGTYIIKSPKTVSSIRKIELGDSLVQYLDSFRNEEIKTGCFDENWFIFGRYKPLPHTNVQRYKDVAVKKAKVKNITIHQFRHSHASYLINNDMNIVSVSKRLGHSNVGITLETYTHLYDKTDTNMIDFISKSSQNLLNK